VGTPVDGVRISLSSTAETPGEGLVTVTSPGVGIGYVPHPDSRLAGGTFQTSDVAVWEGEELALRRRADRVINVRGRKVDPAEVERVVAALDGVEDVVVTSTARPGDEDGMVRAIVACPSGALAYETIARWCQERLADHKVPRSIVIVEEIPRTGRGKVDGAAITALAATERRADRGDA
jgi:long-chain acyl-CoA synthetase